MAVLPHVVPLGFEFVYWVCFFDVLHSWGSLLGLERMGRVVCGLGFFFCCCLHEFSH